MIPENWRGVDGPPNGPNDTATFSDAISGPATVATNEPVTVNRIDFINTDHSYAVGGLGSINLTASTTNPTNPSIGVQGTHEFQVRVALHDDTTMNVGSNSTLEFVNRLSLNGKTLTKTGDGTLVISNELNTGGGTLIGAAGVIAGEGNLAGSLVNNGAVIAPGNSAGALANQIPEPTTVALLGLGGLLLIFLSGMRDTDPSNPFGP